MPSGIAGPKHSSPGAGWPSSQAPITIPVLEASPVLDVPSPVLDVPPPTSTQTSSTHSSASAQDASGRQGQPSWPVTQPPVDELSGAAVVGWTPPVVVEGSKVDYYSQE